MLFLSYGIAFVCATPSIADPISVFSNLYKVIELNFLGLGSIKHVGVIWLGFVFIKLTHSLQKGVVVIILLNELLFGRFVLKVINLNTIEMNNMLWH